MGDRAGTDAGTREQARAEPRGDIPQVLFHQGARRLDRERQGAPPRVDQQRHCDQAHHVAGSVVHSRATKQGIDGERGGSGVGVAERGEWEHAEDALGGEEQGLFHAPPARLLHLQGGAGTLSRGPNAVLVHSLSRSVALSRGGGYGRARILVRAAVRACEGCSLRGERTPAKRAVGATRLEPGRPAQAVGGNPSGFRKEAKERAMPQPLLARHPNEPPSPRVAEVHRQPVENHARHVRHLPPARAGGAGEDGSRGGECGWRRQ
mmetsp:Transcript_3500/g.7686  ORF Transcript_3500/g.7686 Transcript_3500/m.7686 type:complete len:264 (+) Transcript_3500:187-978(+)